MPTNQPVPGSPTPTQPLDDPDSLPFLGYHRADGLVGTRNYWLVIPLFFENTPQLSLLKDALLTTLGYNEPNPYLRHLRAWREQYQAGSYFEAPQPPGIGLAPKPLFTNIDGVKFLPNLDWPALTASTRTATACDIFWPILTGYCLHPNVGGITVLCRPGTAHFADTLREHIYEQSPTFAERGPARPFIVVEQPAQMPEFDWIRDATRDMFEAMTVLNRQTRQPASLSHLTIGFQCGQTNGFSTYPAIGRYANLLAESGATVFMTDPHPAANSRHPIAHPCSYFWKLPKRGLQVLRIPGDAAQITTALTAAGCTLHLSMSETGRLMGNPIAPVAELDTTPVNARQPAHATALGSIDIPGSGVSQTVDTLLQYSLELASGNQRTQSENGGCDDFKLYKPAL